MDRLQNYNIAFVGLKVGKHHYSFSIKQEFFKLFDTEQEFENADIAVLVELDKHSTFLEFLIKTSGNVDLVCDISGEDFSQPIENQIKVLVKFGEEYDDSNEEIITIPSGDSEFNIAQLIYEAVVLSIPMKKISPNISDENLNLLDKYSPKTEEENDEEDIDESKIDPRWAALNKLKDKK